MKVPTWQILSPDSLSRSTNTGPAYSNWASSRGEPNNSGGNENGVTLGRYHLERAWNDEGAAISSIGGFIVEYDVPLDATCSSTEEGCVTLRDETGDPGQVLEFPEMERPASYRLR